MHAINLHFYKKGLNLATDFICGLAHYGKYWRVIVKQQFIKLGAGNG